MTLAHWAMVGRLEQRRPAACRPGTACGSRRTGAPRPTTGRRARRSRRRDRRGRRPSSSRHTTASSASIGVAGASNSALMCGRSIAGTVVVGGRPVGTAASASTCAIQRRRSTDEAMTWPPSSATSNRSQRVHALVRASCRRAGHRRSASRARRPWPGRRRSWPAAPRRSSPAHPAHRVALDAGRDLGAVELADARRRTWRSPRRADGAQAHVAPPRPGSDRG